jgi:hypothetical protein
MRALLSKIMTGSMVAGAALLVAACGGGGEEAGNNVTDINLTEVEMGNDTTVIDSTNGTDAMNMGTGMDNTMSNTTTTTDTTTTTTNTATTNGM